MPHTDLTEYEKQMKDMVRILSELLKTELGKLQNDGGYLVNSKTNIERLSYVINKLNREMKANGLPGINEEQLNQIKSIGEERIAELDKLFAPVSAMTPSLIINEATLKAMRVEGFNNLGILSQQASDSVRAKLFQQIITGTPIRKAAKELADDLGNKLGRYSETYLRTAERWYSQAIETQVAEEARNLGFEIIYEYVGPDDNLTRPECEDALNKQYFTQEEMEAFEMDTEPRYNCRHIFEIAEYKDING